MSSFELPIIADFPRSGVNYVDIFPIFSDKEKLTKVSDFLLNSIPDGAIVVPESRGFLLSSLVLLNPGRNFVMIPCRKEGKLPPLSGVDLVKVSYHKEYGVDTLELRRSDISKIKDCENVTFLDDILATGNTAAAVSSVLESLGKEVTNYVFLGEVSALNGRSLFGKAPISVMFKV